MIQAKTPESRMSPTRTAMKLAESSFTTRSSPQLITSGSTACSSEVSTSIAATTDMAGSLGRK